MTHAAKKPANLFSLVESRITKSTPSSRPAEKRRIMQAASQHTTSGRPPEIVTRLELLNSMATYDETTRELAFPPQGRTGPEAVSLLTRLHLLLRTPCPAAAQKQVWSFDIDLTLELPEDEPGCRGVIPVAHLRDLQQRAVVGTCSDREPSQQRLVMEELGFRPDFCIPKEMLHTLAALLPGADTVHVGDDPQRDRDIAAAAGIAHRWPSNALNP